jgi:hypothetical protein
VHWLALSSPLIVYLFERFIFNVAYRIMAS